MTSKNILIVGTGTIGEPLIGLLSDLKEKLKIKNVFFHKRTPLVDEIAKVNSLLKRGAKLVTYGGDVGESFEALGHTVTADLPTALRMADVVIDCTPAGNANKEEFYLPLSEGRYCATKNKKRIFIAQGSEKGFGIPYAYGINDEVLEDLDTEFIQVVSCNTHNICSLIKTIAGEDPQNLVRGDFTCIRRANDISQEGSFIPSPEIGKHSNNMFGTHHAKDAYDVFATLYQHPDIYSSALKVNTQYMHIIRFNLEIKAFANTEDIIARFEENKFAALTHKKAANRVFSFGRDHGYYGRIFNHTVVATDSLATQSRYGNTQITGFCFTPQDGNSLLSSCAAAMRGIHGKNYNNYMRFFDEYLFDMV